MLVVSSCDTSILFDNDVVNESVKFDSHPNGVRPNGVSSFSINDCKWEACDITYFIQNSSNQLDISEEKLIYRWAFDKWSEETGLVFTESNSDLADIIILYEENDDAGDELGYSFFPCSEYDDRAGNIILDLDETWTSEIRNDREQPIDLYTVILHEIGHALGLEHTDVEDAIMWADYTGSKRGLQQDDIQGIRNIYQCNDGSNQGNGGGTTSPSGLVAYFPLNQNSNDFTNYQNDGILLGAINTSDRNGQAYNAMHFTGYSPEDNPSRIEILNSSSLVFNQSFSFTMWTKIDNYTAMNYCGELANENTFQTLFAKNFSDGEIHAGIRYDGVQAKLEFGDGISVAVANLPNNFAGFWHHVAFTYNGNQMNIYMDGNLKSTVSANIDLTKTNESDLILGAHYYGAGGHNNHNHFWYPLNGGLDEFRVYNIALSDSEIEHILEL